MLTPEAYLAQERVAEYKSEYLRGEVYAMTGASPAHNIIVANVIVALGVVLRSRPCTLYPSDMRVQVPATAFYTYPDVVIVCGVPRYDADGDTLQNPTVLIEVLSPSTEAYDRGQKFAHYRKLDSLQEYLLIGQATAHIEHFTRQPDDRWLLAETDELGDTLYLSSIDCSLALGEVYRKVWAGEADEA